MPARVRSLIAALLLGFGVCLSAFAQHAQTAKKVRPQQTVTADDGLSVIAAALDPKVRRHAGQDCSHLVHAIYEKAGFPYSYANSDDLYDGVDGFVRVSYPQPGDVIVWHGHAGIVVRPSRHVFFSFMRSGPGISDYESRYWTARGKPRFYRYIKNG
ncbi:MAG: hypothetical protein WAN03_19110, partial [Candidatus Sulfotelmatobacter sp.]